MKQQNENSMSCLHPIGFRTHQDRGFEFLVDNKEDTEILTTLCNHLRQVREGDGYVMFFQQRAFLLEVSGGYRNLRTNYDIAVSEILPSARCSPTDEMRSRLFQSIRKQKEMCFTFEERKTAYAALAAFAPNIDGYFELIPYRVSRAVTDTLQEDPISFERMVMYFRLTVSASEVGKISGMGISVEKEERIWEASGVLCGSPTVVSLLRSTTPEMMKNWRQTFYSESLGEDCINMIDVISAVYGVLSAVELSKRQLAETDWLSIYRAMCEDEKRLGIHMQNIEDLLEMSCISKSRIRGFLLRLPKPCSFSDWQKQLFLHYLLNDSSKYLSEFLDWFIEQKRISENGIYLLQNEKIFEPYRKMLKERGKEICDEFGVKFATVCFFCQIPFVVGKKPLSARDYNAKIPRKYREYAKEAVKKMLDADFEYGKNWQRCLRSDIVREAVREYKAQRRADMLCSLKESVLTMLNLFE